ncbi:MAG TPA: hypothetical protein VLM40_17140 [Gemmata sp.]|nr:hypothetical protein [Gemmata sp.]
MTRYILAAGLCLGVIALAGLGASAQEKKGEKKTLEGTLVCTKCSLSETKTCGNALIVKDGDKKVTYYLSDKGGKAPYHKSCCTKDVEGVKVTGTVTEKDGKKTIQEPKVELPKK